jgi:plastocyanin
MDLRVQFHFREEGCAMKSRTAFGLPVFGGSIVSAFVAAALLLVTAGCGGSQPPAEKAEAPKAAAPAAAVDPATAATITGSVKFDGTAARPRRINMAAEPSCAASHASQPPMTQEVVTGGGNSLANVVVYVKSGLSGAAPAASESVEIDQLGCVYIPHVVAVQTNQAITIKNSDKTTHNIHPTPAVNREWNESQPQGAAPLNKSFAREEIAIPVKCNVHPWMKSYIAVIGHPYFAVSDATGSFTIKNLPPGTYTLEAWHEKFGTQTMDVTVAAKESKAADFTFKATSGD